MKPILFLFISMFSTGCSMFEHRDFAREMGFGQLQLEDEPTFMANRDFMVVAGDDGRYHRNSHEINYRTPATAKSRDEAMYESGLKRELVALENQLDERQYSNYLRYRSQLGSTSEKIYFLRLGHRQQGAYLNSRGITGSDHIKSSSYARNTIALPDVTLGMSKDQVVGSWGRPRLREVAGNPSEGNERWSYSHGGLKRYIYFEAGRVNGWTTE